jgi:hypothetical protein
MRPPQPPPKAFPARFTVTFTEEVARRIRALCLEESVPPTQFMRQAILDAERQIRDARRTAQP